MGSPLRGVYIYIYICGCMGFNVWGLGIRGLGMGSLLRGYMGMYRVQGIGFRDIWRLL